MPDRPNILFIVAFPDEWKAGSTVSTPVSLLDLLPTFGEIAGVDDMLPHDGVSLQRTVEEDAADRMVFAQAHEAVGMPCIMARQGKYKFNYFHGYDGQLFDLESDPGEWHNLVNEASCEAVSERFRSRILERFDPETIAAENLESLYRRRLIRDTMTTQGRTWTHFPSFDARKGASDQYFA